MKASANKEDNGANRRDDGTSSEDDESRTYNGASSDDASDYSPVMTDDSDEAE